VSAKSGRAASCDTRARPRRYLRLHSVDRRTSDRYSALVTTVAHRGDRARLRLSFPSHVSPAPVFFMANCRRLHSPGVHAGLGTRARPRSYNIAVDTGLVSAARVHRCRCLEPPRDRNLAGTSRCPEAARILTEALGRDRLRSRDAQSNRSAAVSRIWRGCLEWFENVGYSAASMAWNASSGSQRHHELPDWAAPPRAPNGQGELA